MAIDQAARGTRLDEAAVREFQARLRGQLLQPGDAAYQTARRVFNAMIDRKPALIARCAGAADVVSAVKFARAHDLLVAVRGGGHSVGGHSVCEGGLVIDLSAMKGIRVDPGARAVRAEPGLRLGELDAETAAFGLATPLGIISNTGIAGLTLGGGIGWLNGKHGLALDNVLALDVVTADGELLHASETENLDLFWALRGGSGNFGIVTSFEYRLHPVETVLGGALFYPFDRAREVLRFYGEFAAACPDELSTMAALLTGPDGNPVVAVALGYCGALDAGEAAVRPLRQFMTPVAGEVGPMPHRQLQLMLDGAFPQGNQHYWKSNFIRTLTDAAIETALEHVARKPSPLSIVAFQQLHGAAARVSPTATAFAHRAEQYDFLILAQWSDPAEAEPNVRWARGLWEAMQPFVERGVYVNNLGEEGDDRAQAAYGPNYGRLAALKRRYDPTNFFRRNQNISPAG